MEEKSKSAGEGGGDAVIEALGWFVGKATGVATLAGVAYAAYRVASVAIESEVARLLVAAVCVAVVWSINRLSDAVVAMLDAITSLQGVVSALLKSRDYLHTRDAFLYTSLLPCVMTLNGSNVNDPEELVKRYVSHADAFGVTLKANQVQDPPKDIQ